MFPTRQADRPFSQVFAIAALTTIMTLIVLAHPSVAFASNDVIAILYEDKTVVFQHSESDLQTSIHGDVVATGKDGEYNWQTNYWRNVFDLQTVRAIVFREPNLKLNPERFFANLTSLRSIEGLENLVPSSDSIAGMFSGCAASALNSLDFSKINTSDIVDMSGLFSDCKNLRKIDISDLNASKVEDMSHMFEGCSSLQSVELPGRKPTLLRTTAQMFRNCTSLKTINLSALSGAGRSTLSSTQGMFAGCSALEYADLLQFDFTHALNMSSMFSDCSSLKNVYLAGNESWGACSISGMFRNCRQLETIDLSRFHVTPKSCWNGDRSGTAELFSGCVNLRAANLTGIDCRFRPSAESAFKDCNRLATVVLECWHPISALPTPNSAFIPRATGKWIDPLGRVFSCRDSNALEAYVNSVAGTYQAQLQPNSLTKAKVMIKNRSYTGKTLKPSSVTVKLGGKTLRKNVDYTVSCKGGKKVGSYKVTIKGKGAYRGSKSATFKIVPKGTSLSKLKKARKGFTVIWKKQARETNGYQIRYSTSKSMKGAKTKTAEGRAKSSLKIAKLKGGKKYYVQVRTYKKAGGKTYYSSWSKAKTVRTAK